MCIRDRQNTVVDALSRVNLDKGTFEVDREDIVKIYHVYAEREELANLLNQIKEEQIKDDKLTNIRTRILNNDMELVPCYQIVNEIMFIKPNTRDNRWKLYVPKRMEPQIITTYHQVYGHMGPTKVIKALEEHAYIKGINKKVRLILRKCGLCQRVKVNNEKKEGVLITITSERKLEEVFLDICGPFPRLSLIHI